MDLKEQNQIKLINNKQNIFRPRNNTLDHQMKQTLILALISVMAVEGIQLEQHRHNHINTQLKNHHKKHHHVHHYAQEEDDANTGAADAAPAAPAEAASTVSTT